MTTSKQTKRPPVKWRYATPEELAAARARVGADPMTQKVVEALAGID